MGDSPFLDLDGFQMPGGQFIRRDLAGRMLFGDAEVAEASLLDLFTGGGFLTPAAHEQLRQLPHLIPLSGPTHTTNSGKYIEVTYSGAWESAVRWWKSAAMGATDLMASVTITRNPNQTVSLEVWREYASDGVTVVRTVSRAFTYSGVRVTSIMETIT